jgi:hypothetical protein
MFIKFIISGQAVSNRIYLRHLDWEEPSLDVFQGLALNVRDLRPEAFSSHDYCVCLTNLFSLGTLDTAYRI